MRCSATFMPHAARRQPTIHHPAQLILSSYNWRTILSRPAPISARTATSLVLPRRRTISRFGPFTRAIKSNKAHGASSPAQPAALSYHLFFDRHNCGTAIPGRGR